MSECPALCVALLDQNEHGAGLSDAADHGACRLQCLERSRTPGASSTPDDSKTHETGDTASGEKPIFGFRSEPDVRTYTLDKRDVVKIKPLAESHGMGLPKGVQRVPPAGDHDPGGGPSGTGSAVTEVSVRRLAGGIWHAIELATGRSATSIPTRSVYPRAVPEGRRSRAMGCVPMPGLERYLRTLTRGPGS